MRMVVAAALVVVLASGALAAVSVGVYRADEHTPLAPIDPNEPHVYHDIMVGTRLTLFVSSDAPGGWAGGVHVPRADLDKGMFSGRPSVDFPLQFPFEESLLEAAGYTAEAYEYMDAETVGVELLCGRAAVPGDWLVLDYHAKAVGTCDLLLYEYPSVPLTEDYVPDPDVPIDLTPPIEIHHFNHVPSRDFNDDHIVNFADFAMMTAYWAQVSVRDPVNGSPFDLNADARVDMFDIPLFAEFWLEQTDCNEPNSPALVF